MNTCKQCGRQFAYDGIEGTGYAEDLCGPYCDGVWTATQRLEAELDRLRSYVEADCECRECQIKRHCLPGCRYEIDSPDGWERMTAARKAMWGDNTKGE